MTNTNPTDKSWIKNYWRPIMAYQYAFVCVCDFVLLPIANWVFFAYTKQPYIPWMPLTLKESMFYHISMGSIVGVSSWSRGREKQEAIKAAAALGEEPDKKS